MTEKFQNFLSWNIYQIYPRSFCDSNNDGIGDLPGVISKLDYLKDLGINAIWLCPCYKSPNEDHGYDVADYRAIMDEFGTMEDMRRLIAELHKRDMELIMDLVPNHTSSDHVWFQESRKSRDNPYSDFYYWFDVPPNDWQSCFGGSAWQFDGKRGQYYLHSYAPGQPDLNWENPRVREEMEAVVDFWVDMGADGFRIDVIDQISKDFENGQNMFGPHLHAYIRGMFGREKTAHLFTVGECWAEDIREVRRHIGPERKELSTLFQFDHQNCGRAGDKFIRKPEGLEVLWSRLRHWQNLTQEQDLLYSLFTDNHDNGWMLSRMGDPEKYRYESATCIATMVYCLRGVPFIYQGQEFGMADPAYDSIAAFDDVESINKFRALCEEMPEREALDRINFGSRDNTRRPMCWNGAKNGGFSETEPWIPAHSGYETCNLEKDLASDKSVWRFYRDLLALRKNHPALTVGSFEEVTLPRSGCCCFRRILGDQQVTVVCNFEKPRKISVPDGAGTLMLSNYGHREKRSDSFESYEIAVFLK